MPYTPPSQQSPASSKTSSPVISRSSSYSEEPPRSPAAGRPQPPRSSHSTSYLTKHRRSPSITTSTSETPYPAIRATDFAQSDSVRQSPPPINKNRIPTGAVISPPDSSENSDGDENTDAPGRDFETSWDQLKEAVRAIDQRRETSPDGANGNRIQSISAESVSQSPSPTALTAEARKISHSRSSTETAIILSRTPSFAESPAGTSDDSDEEQSLMVKPSLVRKKSGELVKPALRPSSRRRYSSMPGTPTYSKSVHFNDNGNQTRHFLQVDKPIAVSAGTSPVETYDSESEYPFEKDAKSQREIKLTNFPPDSFERTTRPVRVERIFLSQDKQTLIGTVAVQNISFHKVVIARFTLDYWKTTSEVVAEYNNIIRGPPSDGCDRFNFHIKLSDQANIDTKTLLLCVRYSVGGTDYWDNNDNINYQVDFIRSSKKPERSPASSGLGARPLNALPRSRHSPSRGGHPESVDDDFATGVDTSSAYNFGNVDNILGESSGSIKLKPKRGRGSLFQHDTGASPANGLGGRYDFGASLSAALSNAQDNLGRQSGLMSNRAVPKASNGSYFGPLERKEGPTKTDERPDMLTTDRPAMGSDQYKDLVSKFCYFTPGSGRTTASSPQSTVSASLDIAKASSSARPVDGAAESASASASTSGTASPAQQYDGESEHSTPALSPFISRSASPSRVTGPAYGARASSPISFGYPYHNNNTRDGYLSDSSRAPAAIRG